MFREKERGNETADINGDLDLSRGKISYFNVFIFMNIKAVVNEYNLLMEFMSILLTDLQQFNLHVSPGTWPRMLCLSVIYIFIKIITLQNKLNFTFS